MARLADAPGPILALRLGQITGRFRKFGFEGQRRLVARDRLVQNLRHALGRTARAGHRQSAGLGNAAQHLERIGAGTRAHGIANAGTLGDG